MVTFNSYVSHYQRVSQTLAAMAAMHGHGSDFPQEFKKWPVGRLQAALNQVEKELGSNRQAQQISKKGSLGRRNRYGKQSLFWSIDRGFADRKW